LKDGSDSRFEGKELHTLLKESKQGSTFLNIGALSRKLPIPAHITLHNVDISYYPHVDLVADGQELPIKSESVDGVLLKNVLEHVEYPERILAEVKRILKPGGILYIKNPFLQPFHAVPDDFTRWTRSGNPTLFEDMEEVDYGVSIGPSSAISWILREYCALFWSFGSRKAYVVLLEVFGWLTFWIKYLDIFFRNNKESHRLASAFYGIYRKK
jgi:SAM-dependent methyltransferase